MRFRTTLNKEEQQFVIEKWNQGVSKAEIGRQLVSKFELLDRGMGVTANGARKRVEGLIKQYEAHQHRPNAYNEFMDDQDMMPDGFTHGWIKRKLEDGTSVSAFVRNPEIENELENLQEEIIDSMKRYAPKYPKLKRKKCKEGHLLVISPADVHVGKLASAFETGEDYDSELAVKRVIEGVKGILEKASGFNIEKILFIGGNDILHTDTPRRTTTSGTPQDCEGQRYDNFVKAKKLYIQILELLITVADVHFVFNPSNHDFMSGFFLAQTIDAWFTNNKNITFDIDMKHRKYYVYGDNLVGSTHGDGAKPSDLPLLMAQECKDWSNTKHRYIYTHHVHHKVAKDYIGVSLEALRSPSGTDGWHHRNGYQHNPKAIEGFLHHPLHGQICRFTHLF